MLTAKFKISSRLLFEIEGIHRECVNLKSRENREEGRGGAKALKSSKFMNAS